MRVDSDFDAQQRRFCRSKDFANRNPVAIKQVEQHIDSGLRCTQSGLGEFNLVRSSSAIHSRDARKCPTEGIRQSCVTSLMLMPHKSLFDRVSPHRSGAGLPEGRVRVASLDTYLQRSRIIPAIRSPAHIPAARVAPGAIVYLLTGDVTSIAHLIGDLSECGKLICVNIDLLGGLSSDRAAVDFIAKAGAAGIISTHAQTLKAARSRDLFAIQRSFMLDSQAVANTARSLELFSPDAVEILPAMVAPRTFPRLRAVRADLPIIAGGLVVDLVEIDRLVAAGVDAVSASEPGLWVA